MNLLQPHLYILVQLSLGGGYNHCMFVYDLQSEINAKSPILCNSYLFVLDKVKYSSHDFYNF